MDRETWWATVHGVTKSRVMMEQLTLSLRHPENLLLTVEPKTPHQEGGRTCFLC